MRRSPKDTAAVQQCSKFLTIIKRRKAVCILILVIAVSCIIISGILPPSRGKMPAFHDDKGNVISGSISERTYIDVDGNELGLLITAKDATKPVLLFLGGGPGIPEYLLEYEYPTGIADEFVVCYLEYRGTSISYQSDMAGEEMTTQRYLLDINAVTNYLRERFQQERIYLLGHSFGTFLGIQAAFEHPELYHAYIAMSQITNQSESEKMAYQYMEEQYKAENNSNMLHKFMQYPILSSEKAYQDYMTSSLRDKAMHELGIGTMREMDSVIKGIFLPSLRCKVYTARERINIWRSKAFIASTPVAVERTQFNAFESIPYLTIPTYFFAGKYDYTCCYSLQKEYYKGLKTSLKGFYTFENSAHSPLFEEAKRAMEILKRDVLEHKNLLSD